MHHATGGMLSKVQMHHAIGGMLSKVQTFFYHDSIIKLEL